MVLPDDEQLRQMEMGRQMIILKSSEIETKVWGIREIEPFQKN